MGGCNQMKDKCRVEAIFHDPPDDLKPYFTTFCFGHVRFQHGAFIEDAMQPEWGTLRFFTDAAPVIRGSDGMQLEGARFLASGPSSRLVHYAMPQSRFWGLGLLPRGWALFVQSPASDFANRYVNGEEEPAFAHFAPLATALLDAQLSPPDQLARIIAFFREHLLKRHKEDPRIARIHRCLMQPDLPNVTAMADSCAIGGRTLERLCRKAFGFPPKLLLRRQRFMRSLSHFMLDSDASWSEAIDALYYDQSHFVRDSHHFLGMTPGEYAALDHLILRDFMRDRARIKGSAAQTLDLPYS